MATSTDALRTQFLTKLHEELTRPPKTELISAHDYKRLLARSEFQCPKIKNIQGLCIDPNRSCPPRPRPCEICPSWKRYKRIFKAKKSTQEIIDEAFTELQKKCAPCILPDRHYDEPDYFEQCIKAIAARFKLEKINRREIRVKPSGWGVAR